MFAISYAAQRFVCLRVPPVLIYHGHNCIIFVIFFIIGYDTKYFKARNYTKKGHFPIYRTRFPFLVSQYLIPDGFHGGFQIVSFTYVQRHFLKFCFCLSI